MKVLFLDIDGVCNNYRTMERFKGFLGINPELAAKIKRIITDTGCTVILSSTWRLDEPFRAEVRRVVCDFADITPDNQGLTGRGTEVKQWLDKHPEVTTYAILDDNTDFHKDQPFFKTDVRIGITEDIMNAVIKHLNGGK